jgi:hemoglobin
MTAQDRTGQDRTGQEGSGQERRERISAEIAARTGITEAMIEHLVHAFYAKVRSDSLLAPVFAARIADWEPHLAQMCAFWSSVALMTGRYHGTPMVKHMPLPVDAEHFDRWLALFEQTANETCPPQAAAHFVERAGRIASSLELGIANGQGVMLAVGERFRRQTEAARPCC